MALVVKKKKKKNPPANAGETGDAVSIPGLGRSPGGYSVATHSSILAQRIPWIVEPGGLQSMGSQRVGMTEATQQQQH